MKFFCVVMMYVSRTVAFIASRYITRPLNYSGSLVFKAPTLHLLAVRSLKKIPLDQNIAVEN